MVEQLPDWETLTSQQPFFQAKLNTFILATHRGSATTLRKYFEKVASGAGEDEDVKIKGEAALNG